MLVTVGPNHCRDGRACLPARVPTVARAYPERATVAPSPGAAAAAPTGRSAISPMA